MKIYRGAIEILEFTSDGREFRDLDTHEHSLSFNFELDTYVELKKGDRISYNGKNFYLPKDFIVEKNKSTDGYRYDLTFYDITRRFDDFILKFEGNTDFPLNATGADHLKLVSDNLYDAGIGVFSYSVIPDVKEIQYDNKTILEALDLIAETYELEWWLDGDIINLGICEFGQPVILEYDVELEDISFSEASEKMITRLYAFGGTRNMLYGKRLTLPPEHPYVDLFANLPSEQIVEGVKIFDDIYPRQENTITEVTSQVIYPDDREHQNTTVFTFKCSGINVTQADLLPGQPLKMAFTSGQLNGREFEIIIPDDLSNGYEIKYEQEGDNYFPNPTLRPQVGDTFFFFGFRAETVMPELVTAAQNELFSAAQEYIDSLGIDYVFDVKTRSIYCEENNIDLGIGQIVTLKSDYLGTITSRIRSYEKNINNIFDATYSIGSYSRYSRISAIEKETGKKVDKDEFIGVRDNVERVSGDIQNMYLTFLSKVSADTAQEIITFIKGIKFGDFVPGLLGSGGRIDGNGNGELRSLRLWETLEVPELRYNRAEVFTGVQWQTFGAGIIESVEIDTDEYGHELQSGIITLKLEDGEFGAIDVDDFCQGIYHNFDGQNDTVSEDQRNGNFHFQGFRTSYFRITEILDEGTNGRFRYVLRGTSERWNQLNHPKPFMHFACYANPSNPDRQACSYSTTEYSIRLRNMTTWEYGEDNIYAIEGKLDGFKLGETIFQGNGQVIGNGYFYGNIQNVVNAPYELLIEHDGDNFLAFGESLDITCKVRKGLNDVTDEVEEWSVTRESGNQTEDDAWNIAHQDFAGQITLHHGPTYSDLGEGLSTLFRFVASAGSETAILNLTI